MIYYDVIYLFSFYEMLIIIYVILRNRVGFFERGRMLDFWEKIFWNIFF